MDTTTDPFAPTPVQDTFLRGTVESIVASDTRVEFGQTLIRQLLILRIPELDTSIEVPYETSEAYVGRQLRTGNKVIVGKSNIAGEESYYISDVYRLNSLIWVGILFLVITITLIGKRGWFAIGGLVVSYLIIVYYLIPQVLGGSPPFMTAFIAALLISSVSLFLAHGLYLRTTIAFLSTMITIGIALVLSYIVVVSTRLSGLGTEEAFYLQYIGDAQIDIRGLLLGGILIGTLGVLDDITTAQAAAVEEIHRANHTLGFSELYRRGISVGKEHIISLVNTLVLAYTGAALPLILLFTVYPQPIWVTLNNEIVVEEIVRMLIGSIALVLSVPFTTMLAAYFFSEKGARIRKKFHWLPFFRSCEDSHACSHSHK
jgi:uncharacterized membrane protein